MQTAHSLNPHYFELCAQGTRRILEEGFTPARGGDISLRDPATNLVYVSAGLADIPFPCSSFSEVEAPDPAVFTLDGKQLCGDKLATIELPMHLAILRARPDVHCVLHTHAPWSTVFAMIGRELPRFPLEQEAWGPSFSVSTAGYAPAGAMEVGDFAVEALGDRPAVMLACHGAVAVGESMERAFANARLLEKQALTFAYEKLLTGGYENGLQNGPPNQHVSA
ncbi:class II aldolase/adducin family protein [Feifania hominis]|uniref:Class II aldolase/adducin family protein n=1 Tax=Feifania hominis TaxID=2763660 RepID=A0A926HUS3_9FIRM|nr:class II aldolase/adducin family protein [Feifania hominis]MBC8537214.1 class II aldolase/adducin family protein [Feifania hominis]